MIGAVLRLAFLDQAEVAQAAHRLVEILERRLDDGGFGVASAMGVSPRFFCRASIWHSGPIQKAPFLLWQLSHDAAVTPFTAGSGDVWHAIASGGSGQIPKREARQCECSANRESWIGLRSERTVAGEFDAPVARRYGTPRQSCAGGGPALSWREVRSVMRRTLAMLLGR